MKTILVFFAVLVLYVSFAKTADAALITKDKSTIRVNVLGAEDTSGLQAITTSVENIISKVNLNVKDNSLVLSYKNDAPNQEIDIENFDGEVIEVTKDKESDSLYILTKSGTFKLQQRGIVVSTNYPVEFSDNLDNVTLQTNSGNRYLTILPYEAVSPLIRTNLIDDLNNSGEIELIELDAGELAYYIQGEKTHSVFDLLSLKADVNVSVSALNGKVLSIDQPVWSRVLNFLKV